ncbi:MAG: hypothetical protein WAN36_01250, partial [Calditrichia bacterium]
MKNIVFLLSAVFLNIQILIAQPPLLQSEGPFAGMVDAVVTDGQSGNVYAASYPGGIFRIDPALGCSFLNEGINFKDGLPSAHGVDLRPGHPAEMIACSENNLYYSSNSGEQWSLVFSGGQGIFREVRFVNDSIAFAFSGSELLRSRNGGQSWTVLPPQNMTGTISAVGWDELNGQIYFSVFDSLLYSSDFGDTWQGVDFPGSGIHDIYIAPAGSELYVVADSIYRRAARSRQWENISAGAPNICWTICQDAFRDSILYLGSELGLYRWSPASAKWIESSSGLEEPYMNVPHLPVIRCIYSDPDHPGVVYAGTQKPGLYRSPDYGQSWEKIGVYGAEINDVLLQADGSRLIVGEPRGVKVRENGNWNYSGLYADMGAVAYTLETRPDNPQVLFAGGQSGTLTEAKINISADGGQTWQSRGIANAGVVTDFALVPHNPNIIIASLRNDFHMAAGIYRSMSGGLTPSAWMPVSGTQNLIVTRLLYCPADTSFYAFEYWGDVYKSSDFGQSFVKVGVIPYYQHPKVGGGVISIMSAAWDGENNRLLAAGPGLWASDDGGADWTQIAPAIGNGYPVVSSVKIRQDNSYYAGTLGLGIFRSRDSGQNWFNILAELPAVL